MIDWSTWQYEPKTDEQLQIIAQKIADGDIFTSDMVAGEDVQLLPQIFAVTGLLGTPAFHEAVFREHLEMFYEYRSVAGPWKVGKYPVFLGCGFLNESEAERVRCSLRLAFKEHAEKLEAERLENNRREEEG